MFEKRHIQSESYLITTTYELKSIYKLENKFNSNYVYFSCLPYFDLSLKLYGIFSIFYMNEI